MFLHLFLAAFAAIALLVGCSGVKEKVLVGIYMANKWTDPPCVIMFSLIGGIPLYVTCNIMIGMHFGPLYTPLLTVFIYLYYQFIHLNTPPADTTKYVEFKVCKRDALEDPVAFGAMLFAHDGRSPAQTTTSQQYFIFKRSAVLPFLRRTRLSRRHGASARCQCTCWSLGSLMIGSPSRETASKFSTSTARSLLTGAPTGTSMYRCHSNTRPGPLRLTRAPCSRAHVWLSSAGLPHQAGSAFHLLVFQDD